MNSVRSDWAHTWILYSVKDNTHACLEVIIYLNLPVANWFTDINYEVFSYVLPPTNLYFNKSFWSLNLRIAAVSINRTWSIIWALVSKTYVEFRVWLKIVSGYWVFSLLYLYFKFFLSLTVCSLTKWIPSCENALFCCTS